MPLRQMDRAVAKSWWHRRPIQLSALGAVVIATAILMLTLLPPPGTVTVDANAIDTGDVIRAPFQDYVPLRSTVVPLDTVYITAQAAGRIEAVTASDGVLVQPGQSLLRLSNPDLTLEVSSREADISGRLSDTNNQLMSLRTQQQAREQALADAAYSLHKAEQELVKRQSLRQQGVLNDAAVKPYADEADYQKSRLASLKQSQAQENAFYRAQGQQIATSATDLRRSLTAVRQALSALIVTAPVTGRLTDFDFKPGQAIKAGDTLGEVDSVGTYKLRAQVDEFYLSRLSNGLKAQARIHDQTVAVHISKIFPQVIDGHVNIEMEFDGAMPADVKRGEAVDVRLSLGNTQMAILAPSGTWLNDSGGAYVFVLNGHGDRADRRPVTLARRNPEYAEIQAGLKPGERIVTGGAQNLTKAQHLRLTRKSGN